MQALSQMGLLAARYADAEMFHRVTFLGKGKPGCYRLKFTDYESVRWAALERFAQQSTEAVTIGQCHHTDIYSQLELWNMSEHH